MNVDESFLFGPHGILTSQVYVTHDKGFPQYEDDDLTDAWKYYWDTMGSDFALPILDNTFIPGSSIDLYYSYYRLHH